MYNVTAEYADNIAKATRYSRIYGQIRTSDGTFFEIGDDDILEGTLSIDSKLNQKGDFRPGGVYSSCLSMTLLNFGDVSRSLNGAKIVMYYDLFRGADSDEYDRIPLGTYWIDGSTIKRKFQTVSFRADDDMMNFDYPAAEVSGTLYDLVIAACSACGIPLRMSDAEFYALPNSSLTATIDTSRIQIWRDLLMYVGIATASFARINRTGGLEFIPLRCDKDQYGMIIPVREIGDLQRFDTSFSDDTVRITKLITRRNGATASSDKEYTIVGSAQPATLELIDVPLFRDLDDAELTTALNNTLEPLAKCLNRAYTAEISGDPALEIGDYVRLVGGSIDTDRGYATGMITAQVWEYRKKHTIKCCLPASVARDSVAVAAALDTDDTGDTRVAPKPQLEKEVDELRRMIAQGGNSDYAKYLQTTDTAAVMSTFATGFTVANPTVMNSNLTAMNNSYGIVLRGNSNSQICADSSIFIKSGKNHQVIANDNGITVYAGGATIRVNANGSISVDNGADAKINLTDNYISVVSGTAKLELSGDVSLVANSTGLKVNGTLVT